MLFNSGTIPIKIKLVRVLDLKKHERIIQPKLQELKLYLRNQTILKNPIIIDKNLIILDGNHRANAFAQLGFKYICACQINYFNKHVKLGYWDRRFSNISNIKHIKSYLKAKNYTLTTFSTWKKLLDYQKTHLLGFGLHYREQNYFVSFKNELVNGAVTANNQLEKFQEFLEDSPEFVPDKYLKQAEFTETLTKSDLIITAPRIIKKMVVEASNNQLVFAPKSTRHIIPSRPLNLDIPIQLLNSQINLSKAQSQLKDYLKKKDIIRFGPGQVIEGRYYEEEILVFLDKNR